MKNLNYLLLKTAFACMVCDGEIDEKEIDIIKMLQVENKTFGDINIEQEIEQLILSINQDSRNFIRVFFDELSHTALSTDEELQLIEVAIQMIEADENIEYNEIRFFKIIRSKLNISNKDILSKYPDWEEYLATDIISMSYLSSLESGFFDSSHLPQFEPIKNFKL